MTDTASGCGYSGSGFGYGCSYVDGPGYGYGSGNGNYGYGAGSDEGCGYGHDSRVAGRMRWIDGVDDYNIWFDPVFGVATIGCQTLTINEWRRQWRRLAANNGCAVDAGTVEAVIRRAVRWMEEARHAN